MAIHAKLAVANPTTASHMSAKEAAMLPATTDPAPQRTVDLAETTEAALVKARLASNRALRTAIAEAAARADSMNRLEIALRH